MEGKLEKSPQLSCPDESMEAKYISGLSTVLVATVQEAKDRISQIEYVFCNQLYPHFQAKSKTVQKLYTEARESAENDFREKEKELLCQIEKLQQEKQQLCGEISSLKLEKEEFDKIGLSPEEVHKLQKEFNVKVESMAEWRVTIKELNDEIRLRLKMLEDKEKELGELLGKYWNLRDKYEGEVEKLKLELAKQTKVVDSGMRLQNKLLQMLHSHSFMVTDREEPLEDLEEKANILLSGVEDMIKKTAELQEKLKEKTVEVERGREVQENLFKKIELQTKEILDYEQQLNTNDKEKRLLTTKLESLENDLNLLRKEIRKKNDEVEEGGKLREHLIQQIDLYDIEKIKAGQEFKELEKEKQELLAKLGGSKEKPDVLQAMAQQRSEDSLEDMELHSKLLQQIERKDSQLMHEKQKRKEAIVAYKKLKSQYNFLCTNYGLTRENAVTRNKMEDESDCLGLNQSSSLSPAKAKGKEEELDHDKGIQRIQRSNSVSPSSRNFIQPKSATNVKSCPPVGTKRPVSHWRDTRSHQSRLGPDIHDDFLDTPLEKAREAGNAKKGGARYPEKPAPIGMDFDDSDAETQDMNAEEGKSVRQQIPPSRPVTSNFKYVEPVRKKSARENLKGIECKQCKKFYDAVLPKDGKEADGVGQSLRCEHHDGVSRHRYRYAPPLTPEGFWNIGFESEM